MKRTKILLCLLAAVFTVGCGKPPASPQPATSDEAITTVPRTSITTQPESTTVPSTEPEFPPETTPASTVPTEITTPVTSPISPPTQGVTLCGHEYQPGTTQAPTCDQAGFYNLVCRKCGDFQQQLSLPLGHSFSDATCLTAPCCTRCGIRQGEALGHAYQEGFCCRCNEKDPSVRIITIQTKDSNNTPLDGVTLELYIGQSLTEYAGSQVSSGGQVCFTLNNHTGPYKLVLSNIPAGYKPQLESYTYRSDSGAIVLDVIPVIYPEDHSKACYQVGDLMGEFTVTDVDGKCYQLSQMLQEKKLVMLNFWFCTCVPCKAEFPYFNSIYQRYRQDIEILALNHFDSEAQVRQLRSQMNLTFPLATEDLGMRQGFGIQTYPFTVFIGSDGRIRYIQKDAGFETEAQLDSLIRQLLGQ